MRDGGTSALFYFSHEFTGCFFTMLSSFLPCESPKIDIPPICHSPLCRFRVWWRCLSRVTALEFHGRNEFQPMDGLLWRSHVTKTTDGIRTAGVVSSKCDSKRWRKHHVCSQDIHCSENVTQSALLLHVKILQQFYFLCTVACKIQIYIYK